MSLIRVVALVATLAPVSALAGNGPYDANLDTAIANAKTTIDGCVSTNEGSTPASGCSDVALVYMPAFYPRVVAPVFANFELSKLSSVLDTVEKGYAQAAAKLQQIQQSLALAMTIPSHAQLAGELQTDVQTAFQDARTLVSEFGTLIDLYNIDSQTPFAGQRFGGAMIPYGALDTLALATATKTVYDALNNSGLCAANTLTASAAEPAGGVGCTTPQYAGLLSVGIKINLWTQWAAGTKGFPQLSLEGKSGAQSLSVDFSNAVTVKVSVEFDIYPPDPWPNQSPNGTVQATVSGHAAIHKLSIDPLVPGELVLPGGPNPKYVTYGTNVSYDLGGVDALLGSLLTDLYSDLAPVVGPLTGPLGLAVLADVEDSFYSKVQTAINSQLKPAINKAIATAQDNLKAGIDGFVTQNYEHIQKLGQEATTAQALVAGFQKSTTSNIFPGGAPRINWVTDVLNGTNDTFDAGTNETFKSPGQELDSTFELVMPGPQNTKGELTATLLLPHSTCNYDVRDEPHTGGPPGPAIPYWMVSYTPGPAPAPGTVSPGGGSTTVNTDLAGKDCSALLKSNLIVTYYKTSKIVQVPGKPESRILPEWETVDHYSVTHSTALALTTQYGTSSYACSFTLTGLPTGVVVRLALSPNDPNSPFSLLGRMGVNAEGSGKSDAGVQAAYMVGGAAIGGLSQTQRNHLFRTSLVLPNPVAPLASAVSAINGWLNELNASIAPSQPDWLGQTLQAEKGFLTLDEHGVPESNFVVGRPSVSDPANECASYEIFINPAG